MTEKVILAVAGLAVAHLLLYFFLTGDTRDGLATLGTIHSIAELDAAKTPGAMPVPGTEAYGAWLRSYERFSASKDYELHARHESLMRYGMVFSFLVAVGFLAAALNRIARTRRLEARYDRGEQPRRKSARSKPAISYAAKSQPRTSKPRKSQPTRRRYRRSA